MNLSALRVEVARAVGLVASHIDKGLCIQPLQTGVPLRLCIRPANEGTHCCTRHKDCPK